MRWGLSDATRWGPTRPKSSTRRCLMATWVMRKSRLYDHGFEEPPQFDAPVASEPPVAPPPAAAEPPVAPPPELEYTLDQETEVWDEFEPDAPGLVDAPHRGHAPEPADSLPVEEELPRAADPLEEEPIAQAPPEPYAAPAAPEEPYEPPAPPSEQLHEPEPPEPDPQATQQYTTEPPPPAPAARRPSPGRARGPTRQRHGRVRLGARGGRGRGRPRGDAGVPAGHARPRPPVVRAASAEGLRLRRVSRVRLNGQPLDSPPDRGHSSVGRAPALHAGGHGFESRWLH